FYFSSEGPRDMSDDQDSYRTFEIRVLAKDGLMSRCHGWQGTTHMQDTSQEPCPHLHVILGRSKPPVGPKPEEVS
ncbi:MAG TPA: hypothetical protein VMW91_06585, partial [Desulfosporosinus sp.]|nr:hypothetical protein [Desulfosporosinus sp.]